MLRPKMCQYASGVTVGRADRTLVVQQRDEHRDRDSAAPKSQRLEVGDPAAADPQQQHHDDRPDQVELLLHRQAPQVA